MCSGKKEVIQFMERQNWNVPYIKVRTKLMNEQRKHQMKAKKSLNFA